MDSKHMLFRMHNQKDTANIQAVIDFAKGYFEMNNKRVKFTFEEFMGYDGNGSENGKMFELFVITKNKGIVDLAHGVAWSYVTAKSGITSVDYVRTVAKNAGLDLKNLWDNKIINFALNYLGSNIEDARLSGLDQIAKNG